ncbi:MAG: OmpA family protein [Panacagrimonas sp.]
MKKILGVGVCIVVAGGMATGSALAQYESGGAAAPAGEEGDSGARNVVDQTALPLIDGSYAALMAQYRSSESDPVLDSAVGGQVMLGYRNGGYGLEAGFGYQSEKGIDLQNFGANVLLYPFDYFYVLAGIGSTRYAKYPIERVPNAIAGGDDFNTVNAQGGIGYLFPFLWGNYQYGIRAEVLYRYSDRFLERESDFIADIAAPGEFKDILVNVGLQLPFRKLAPPPPPPPPVAIVPPAAICADTQDNDGDGLIDFPGDPGCSSADDADETDPPVCSDGKDNDGDGLVDFPADKGCTAADDTDEVDPCKTPAPGERISLKGCGTGDIIVLRGVNFEFDKARLTVNAKTILDNVGEELTAYPEIEVELSGHTDAKGSDEYNQSLSDKRAASVKTYLVSKDIADARMTTVGMGEAQPVADNETDEGRELNRRVELKVTKGVAVGGPTVVEKTAGEAAVVADPSETVSGDPATELVPPAADAAAPAEAAPSDPFANAVP